jgi:hypothetical protein
MTAGQTIEAACVTPRSCGSGIVFLSKAYSLLGVCSLRTRLGNKALMLRTNHSPSLKLPTARHDLCGRLDTTRFSAQLKIGALR